MSSFNLYLDLALVFFFLLTILNYRAHRSVLYPPFIFCAMWLLDLVIFRLNLIEINPLHGNTLAIVAAGSVSFSIGGLLAGLVPRALLRIHLFPSKSGKTTNSLRNLLMIFLLCALPFMFFQTLRLSNSQGGGFNILAQASHAQLEAAKNGESPPFSLHIVAIALGISFLFATEKRDGDFWVVIIVTFIMCILVTGRTELLLLISGMCAIRLLQRKEESLLNAMRLLCWPIALFVMLFIGLIFTNKNTEGMTGGVTGIISSFVFGYIAGPLAAFDIIVQRPTDFVMTTSHTFQFPLSLAANLHIITDYVKPSPLDSFSYVPFPTNVYTVFKFYFLELGIGGALVLLSVIGLLHSLIYLKARQGGKFSTYLFAFTMYPVLMIVFDDQYYLIGRYLRVIPFGLLYFFIGSVRFSLFSANKKQTSLLTNR
jgi:oligosaccharide repeat unit polymerase